MSNENKIKSSYRNDLTRELYKLLTQRDNLEIEMNEAHSLSLDHHQQMNELNIKINQKRSRLENLGRYGGIDSLHVPVGTRMSN